MKKNVNTNVIADVNTNAIIYINTNVEKNVNTNAIADMGTTWNYLILESPCENKRVASAPLSIRMPNG